MHIVMNMNPLKYDHLLMTFIFLLLISHFGSVTSQMFKMFYCSTDRNYTSESSYRANLTSLLSSISSNVGNSGFYNTSVGQVNAIVLCRGDIQPDECRRCVGYVSDEILWLCPKRMEAILWYTNPDFCMLRYSDKPILGTLAIKGEERLSNNENATRPEVFKEIRKQMLDDLRGRAAAGGALRKVAVAEADSGSALDSPKIYGMVQCTPDLSENDCNSCLVRAVQSMRECCDNNTGVRVYLPSCFIRADIEPFYNITRLQEPLEKKEPLENKLEPPLPPPSSEKNDDNTTRNIIIIVISTSMGFILALFVGIIAMKRLKKKTKENPDIHEISTAESIQYDFNQIRAATNDFSEANKLGRGGFGTVYRGKLMDGREIAAKRLSKSSGQGDMEFKNEVLLVARLQHRNLVKLLGFSIEGRERLLIYEFHQNGSLDHFIFDPIKSSNLNWEMRYKIIGGIAKGLLYLHEDSRFRIIHRDLKASNVLLDEEMNPKISDFGMAKLIMPNASQESSSRIAGTYGYIAPEYAILGEFSIKSDVYSFGVLVLEIISGQKKVHFQEGENSRDLLSFAWRSWREGSTVNLIDPILRTSSGNQLDILRCIHIALLCVQKNADDRPTMASVVLMLCSFSSTLSAPLEPGFYVPSSFSKDAPLLQNSSSSSKTRLADQCANLSNKDFSITKLYPR